MVNDELDSLPGLVRLQYALDVGSFPADWPDDVCRDAYCGHWERLSGRYYWHRPSDHATTDVKVDDLLDVLLDGGGEPPAGFEELLALQDGMEDQA